MQWDFYFELLLGRCLYLLRVAYLPSAAYDLKYRLHDALTLKVFLLAGLPQRLQVLWILSRLLNQ